ncbi:hypothetical protein ACN42_g3062 [Penicillium freii]|uniref:Uncharacterized protein n=1 Tax=Penicillium freii TaxID=48697 RepID=A0A117NQH7_PENFR|nr:hypothetical protein ACN42_g3062 [Penicillium freii]
MPFGVSYLELLANARGHSLIFALLTYARSVARSWSWSGPPPFTPFQHRLLKSQTLPKRLESIGKEHVHPKSVEAVRVAGISIR